MKTFDKNILLVKDGDGGDSCSRTMTLRALNIWDQGLTDYNNYIYKLNLDALKVPGSLATYVRNPDPEKWYSNPNTLSRDQAIPLVVAMGVHGDYKNLFRFFLRHLFTRGLLFTWNTRKNFQYPTYKEHLEKAPIQDHAGWTYAWKMPDVTLFEFWALYIRGFWPILKFIPVINIFFYMICSVFDLETLGGSIVLRHYRKDDNDVQNHTLICLYSQKQMRTPTSYLIRRFTDWGSLKQKLVNWFTQKDEPDLHVEFFTVMEKEGLE